mmetsp:Transcript_19402/g.26925  ORF Transcript_19402/g.26925 Transcript_19402/m.26925 type:complete len:367 (-) Transcript_19402:39-1139(-)
MMLSSTPTQDPRRYRSVFLPVLMFLVCCSYTPTSSSNISVVVHGLSPLVYNISPQQQRRRQNTSNNNIRNRKTSTILLNNNNGQVVPETSTTNAITTTSSRRSFVGQIVFKSIAATTASAGVMETCCRPSVAMDNNNDATNDNKRGFVSDAFPKAEYTNSIVASRDTNVSPKEVYDSILSIKGNSGKSITSIAKDGAPQVAVPSKRALDVGAGAGVSTQVLYEEMGYTTIDALDWSGDAWDLNVVQNGYCPPSVQFYELDDERFYNTWKSSKMEPYDVIVFNFAVNKKKALKFAKELLKEDGLLLAPVNTQTDYWLKQTYVLLTAQGTILWSANDVGAWSVQFQPDVTQDTCQGIWCPPYNGFKKQ